MREDSCQKAYDFICSVKNDLKYKNRFSVSPQMEELLSCYANEDSNTDNIKQGEVFYRARVYKDQDALEKYKNQVDGAFNGFDKEGSFVNLKNIESIPDERCNPSFIPYLYMSSTEKCCISEMRPIIGTYISVAKIEVLQNLKILRFDQKINCSGGHNDIVQGVSNATLSLFLSLEFSRPYKSPGDYILCQYVSEKVKSLGYDGLSFESSVCKKDFNEITLIPLSERSNANITIFNFEKCRPISSKLVYIDDVDIKYS